MIKLKLLVLFLFIIPFTTINAQQQVKGFVFEDVNNNGKKDKSETGIQKVAVSNGKEVVLTNKNGFYELPIGNDDIIFVIKPAEYKFKIDENNLPQFYYNHKPKGSPVTLKYKAVPATGILPPQVNFGLQKDTTGKIFTTLIFGDPQPANEIELAQFHKGIVNEVAGIKNVTLGISLGDLVGNRLDLQPNYAVAVKDVGVNWHNVIGNHDMNMDVKSDSLADESFELNFGPPTYAFNIGNVHFILLDNIIYPSQKGGREYIGGFTEKQLLFIENDLKLVPPQKLIVLSMHIPLNSDKNAFRLADRKKLFELLKNFPNSLVLSAHTHLQRNDFLGKKEGWLQQKPLHEFNAGTTSGDWYSGILNDEGIPIATMRDGTPKGYAFINFNDNKYSIKYKAANLPANYQIELFCPKVIAAEKNTARFYANFFMGNEEDTLFYKFDEGDWQKMKYTKIADPTYLAELMKWDFVDSLPAGRRPSNAIASTHLWQADFPKKMKAKTYTLTVKVTDRYGEIYTAEKKFKVQQP